MQKSEIVETDRIFNLHLIYEELYNTSSDKTKVFQLAEKNCLYDMNGLFSFESKEWIECISSNYLMDTTTNHGALQKMFLYFHFGGLRSVIDYNTDDPQRIKRIQYDLFKGEIAQKIIKDIEKIIITDYEQKSDSAYGKSLQAIIYANKYIVLNHCLNMDLLFDKLCSFRKVIENDLGFMTKNNEYIDAKQKYLRKIDAYLNYYQEYLDTSFTSEEIKNKKSEYLATALSWMMIGALMRPIFYKVALINNSRIDTVQEIFSFKESSEIKGIWEKYVYDIKNAATFRLIDQPDGLLLPKGNISDDESVYFLKDVLYSNWTSEHKKNLLIVGAGGAGKTMGVLHFIMSKECNKFSIPAIYIPLNSLGGYLDDSREIAKDIDWYINTSLRDYKDVIYKLSSRNIAIGPNIIIVLDGYNEIDPAYRSMIDKNISNWKRKSGVQLIITSRFTPKPCDDFIKFNTHSLSTEIVIKYLQKQDVYNDINSDVLEVLSNPLFLQLFIQSQRIWNKLDQSYIYLIDRKETIHNASDIVWNYLQVEIYNCFERQLTVKVQDHGITITESMEKDFAFAILFICPYIAYKMVLNNKFFISEEVMREWISESIQFISDNRNQTNKRVLKQIERIDERKLVYRISDDLITLFYDVITKMNIMVLTHTISNEKCFSLMHQCIRDYLCAFNMYDLIYDISNTFQSDVLPENVKKIGDKSVIKALSEILSESELLTLWQNVKNYDHSTEKYIDDNRTGFMSIQTILAEDVNFNGRNDMYWMLSLFGEFYENDFTSIDFSKCNFMNVNLTKCKKEDSVILTLPQNSSQFSGTKISDSTFKIMGHTGKINTICIIPELKVCISGDSSGNVNLWDIKKNKLLCPLQKRKSDIRDIKWKRKADIFQIAVCSYDGEINIYEISEEIINADKCDGLLSKKSIKNPETFGLTVVDQIIEDNTNYVIGGDIMGNIIVWDINNDNTYVLKEHEARINKIVLYKIANHWKCISGGEDFKICLWDLSDLKDANSPVWYINNKPVKSKNIGSHSFIEKSREKSRNMWDNHLIGITDIHTYMYLGSLYALFSDSNGIIRKYNLYDYQHDRAHKVGECSTAINKIGIYKEDNKNIFCLSCSDDGSVTRWDIIKEKEIGSPMNGHSEWATGLSILSEERAITYGHDNKIIFWDIVDGIKLSETPKMIDWIICGEVFDYYSEKCCVVGDACGTLYFWNVSYNYLIDSYSSYPCEIHNIEFFVNNNNQYLAFSSADGTIRIFSLSLKKIICILEGHKGWVNYIYVLEDGNTIISCGSDGKIIVHEINDFKHTQKTSLDGHLSWALGVTSINDEENEFLVSCSYDHSLIIWKKMNHTFKKDKVIKKNQNTNYIDDENEYHIAGIKVVKTINSNSVITGGYDGKVILWENITGNIKSRLLFQHSDWVRDILVLKNGKKAVSVGVDGKMVFYNFENDVSINIYCDTIYYKHIKYIGETSIIALTNDDRLVILDYIDIDDIRCMDTYTLSNEDEITCFEVFGNNCVIGTKEGKVYFININQNIFQYYFDNDMDYKDFNLMQGFSVLGTNLKEADFGIYDNVKEYLGVNGAVI